MEDLYNFTGISRQGIWKYKRKIKEEELVEKAVLSSVAQWRKLHPGMGARPLYHTMKNHGVTLGIGINRFEKLLKINGLNVRRVKSFIPKTSDGKGKGKYRNLTNGLIINDINQLLVGDISYYFVDGKWHYVFSLKDVYSQRFYKLVPSKTLEAKNAIECLMSVIHLRGRKVLKKCIHHTDNGSQYNSLPYLELLHKYNFRISRAENCQQNGSAEQGNYIYKSMYFEKWGVSTFKELKEACKEFEYLNNHQRAIKQLRNISPVRFEKDLKNIPLESRVKKIMYDFTD